MYVRRFALLSSLTVLLCATCHAAGGRAPDPVAIVNGEAITRNELTSTLADWYAPLGVAEMVQYRLVSQEARKAGVIVTQAQIDAEIVRMGASMPGGMDIFQQFRNRGITRKHLYAMVRMRLEAEGVVRKSIRITAGDLDGYRRASQILLYFKHDPASDPAKREAREQEVRSKAQSIAQEIKGGLPFEVAAERYSEDGVTKTKGGDIGWAAKEQVVYDLVPSVFSMKTGEVSAPIRSDYGYYLVKLTGIGTETRGAERSAIVESITQLRLPAKTAPWVESLNARAITRNLLEPERSQLKPRQPDRALNSGQMSPPPMADPGRPSGPVTPPGGIPATQAGGR